jgi:hypothetical protein
VTGGPGGELRIVGKAVIGGAKTGVADPDETGKTAVGDPVTGLADAGDSRAPGAGLVPQAARPTVARLAVVITVKRRARVVRCMLVRRPAASYGSVPGSQDRWRNAIPGRPGDQVRAHHNG